jgi:hypothetical protein
MVIKLGIPFFLVLAALAGCGFNQPFTELMDVRDRPALAEEAPSDIVVLPLMEETGNPTVQMILPELRRAIYRALIARCYTPVSLDHIDARLEKEGGGGVLNLAALRGTFGEDAMLQVRVTGWSERKFRPARRLRAAAEVSLNSSASGRELVGGRLETEVEVPGHGGIGLEMVERMRLRAVDRLAERVVAGLPRRSTLVAGE